MTKLEKVIDSLGRCAYVPDACRGCAYDEKPIPKCLIALGRDALELLREQKPVKPINKSDMNFCGECKFALAETMNYCPKCGKAVKWEWV